MPKLSRKLIVALPHKRTSGLFRTDAGEYVADIKPDDGLRTRRNFGSDKERATVQFQKLLAELEEQREARENPRVVEFLTETFLPTQTGLKCYRFAESRITAVSRFLEDEHPRLRLRDVRKRHGDGLLDYYRDLAPKTRNDNLAKFRQAMNHAVDLDLLGANPLSRCRLLRVDNRRLRVPTLEEFRRLVEFPVHDERCADVPRMVLVMGLTGLRPANVFALQRAELQGDTIQIPPEKMKNARWGVVPVSKLVQWTLEDTGRDGFLFPSPKTGQPRTHIRRTWAKMTARAGVEWMQVYDLRHFFASQMAKLGATEQQIARLLCHVGQSVTSRYVHHDIEDLRPFVEEHSERVQAALDGAVSTLDEQTHAVRL